MTSDDPRSALPPRHEQTLYGQVLEEIKMRQAEAARFLYPPVVKGRVNLNTFHANYGALQLRTAIEYVALGSLVANRPDVERVARAFNRKNADEAAKIVKALNPHYWPRPIRLVVPEDGSRWQFDPITEGFLREEDWRAEWGFLSTLLHAANPYKLTPSQPRPDLAAVYRRLRSINVRLVTLLKRHQVTLVDERVILTGLMNGEDGKVHVQGAFRVDP